MRHLHADAIFRPTKQPRDFDAHERWPLRGRVQRRPSIRDIRDCDERLHGNVHDLLRLELVFEDMIGGGEADLQIPAQQVIVERDIGAATPLEVLQVGKRRGGFELLVNER
jgi:hypothetical protein